MLTFQSNKTNPKQTQQQNLTSKPKQIHTQITTSKPKTNLTPRRDSQRGTVRPRGRTTADNKKPESKSKGYNTNEKVRNKRKQIKITNSPKSTRVDSLSHQLGRSHAESRVN